MQTALQQSTSLSKHLWRLASVSQWQRLLARAAEAANVDERMHGDSAVCKTEAGSETQSRSLRSTTSGTPCRFPQTWGKLDILLELLDASRGNGRYLFLATRKVVLKLFATGVTVWQEIRSLLPCGPSISVRRRATGPLFLVWRMNVCQQKQLRRFSRSHTPYKRHQ